MQICLAAEQMSLLGLSNIQGPAGHCQGILLFTLSQQGLLVGSHQGDMSS